MPMRSVVAIHLIATSDPNAPMVFDGKYDSNGIATLQKQPLSILPGTVFEMDEADPDFLPFLENEAVRLASDAEIQRGRALEL